MPLGLVKYGFSRRYRARRDIPAPRELKGSYDIVIIGAGGHGLSAAYHLAKYHGITNVAVLDKGYLGGGNTARNTAVIRSNYISPEAVAFYKASLTLFENLANDEVLNHASFKRREDVLLPGANVRVFGSIKLN